MFFFYTGRGGVVSLSFFPNPKTFEAGEYEAVKTYVFIQALVSLWVNPTMC